MKIVIALCILAGGGTAWWRSSKTAVNAKPGTAQDFANESLSSVETPEEKSEQMPEKFTGAFEMSKEAVRPMESSRLTELKKAYASNPVQVRKNLADLIQAKAEKQQWKAYANAVGYTVELAIATHDLELKQMAAIEIARTTQNTAKKSPKLLAHGYLWKQKLMKFGKR